MDILEKIESYMIDEAMTDAERKMKSVETWWRDLGPGDYFLATTDKNTMGFLKRIPEGTQQKEKPKAQKWVDKLLKWFKKFEPETVKSASVEFPMEKDYIEIEVTIKT